MDSEEFNYKAYPKAEGVKLLWHDNFWDRPLEGVCEWQNQKYHYDFQPDDDKVRYSMREMDEVEWLARQKRHEQFKEKVGTHCDWIYDAEGKASRQKGALRTKQQQDSYFNGPKIPIPISPFKIIAWFDKWSA